MELSIEWHPVMTFYRLSNKYICIHITIRMKCTPVIIISATKHWFRKAFQLLLIKSITNSKFSTVNAFLMISITKVMLIYHLRQSTWKIYPYCLEESKFSLSHGIENMRSILYKLSVTDVFDSIFLYLIFQIILVYFGNDL